MAPREQTADIYNWGLYRDPFGKVVLIGDAKNHYRLGGRPAVTTTSVQVVFKDIRKVETRNTLYTLRGKGNCQLEDDDPVIKRTGPQAHDQAQKAKEDDETIQFIRPGGSEPPEGET